MLCFKSAICIFIGSVIFFQKCSLQNTHILYFKVIYKLSLLQNLQKVFKTRWSSQTLCFLIAYQDSRAKKKKRRKKHCIIVFLVYCQIKEVCTVELHLERPLLSELSLGHTDQQSFTLTFTPVFYI